MEQIVICLLMAQKFTNLKQRILKSLVGAICIGKISKIWSVDNMKRTGFTGHVYDFSIDYNSTDVDNIKGIHKYLMKKRNENI